MAKTKTQEAPTPVVSHEDDPLLDFSEVGRHLGVTGTTVRKYVEQRLLQAEWRGPLLKIRESELRRFMGKNYTPEE